MYAENDEIHEKTAETPHEQGSASPSSQNIPWKNDQRLSVDPSSIGFGGQNPNQKDKAYQTNHMVHSQKKAFRGFKHLANEPEKKGTPEANTATFTDKFPMAPST